MLEADDFDDDYFTPSTSTSLANIFNQSDINNEEKSLKYVPPKPAVPLKTPETKNYESIFACSVYAHAFLNNVYTDKGKLGFAIMKTLNTGLSHIILYNSDKETLSCTTIQPSLTVNLKSDKYISFYDDTKKYWAISLASEDFPKVINILDSYNAKISQASFHNECELEHTLPEKTAKSVTLEEKSNNKASDTDSQNVNTKSKSSILNRMATMGHSVLPAQYKMKTVSSSSSETSETSDLQRKLRHQVQKNSSKVYDKNTIEHIKCISKPQKKFTVSKLQPKSEDISCLPISYKQLLPVSSTNIISTVNNPNEVSLLLSEQRMNNSEMRKNIGRITDKIDQIYDKFIQKESSNDSFSNEIYQKLLNEYEKKIKMYEEFIIGKGYSIIETTFINKQLLQHESESQPRYDENNGKKKQIIELQNYINDMDMEITNLKSEIKQIQIELNEKNEKLLLLKNENEQISKEIKERELLVKKNKEYLLKIETEHEEFNNYKKILKNVINDIYHSIVANFENDKTYSGSTVNENVLSIIKKIASSLPSLQNEVT